MKLVKTCSHLFRERSIIMNVLILMSSGTYQSGSRAASPSAKHLAGFSPSCSSLTKGHTVVLQLGWCILRPPKNWLVLKTKIGKCKTVMLSARNDHWTYFLWYEIILKQSLDGKRGRERVCVWVCESDQYSYQGNSREDLEQGDQVVSIPQVLIQVCDVLPHLEQTEKKMVKLWGVRVWGHVNVDFPVWTSLSIGSTLLTVVRVIWQWLLRQQRWHTRGDTPAVTACVCCPDIDATGHAVRLGCPNDCWRDDSRWISNCASVGLTDGPLV